MHTNLNTSCVIHRHKLIKQFKGDQIMAKGIEFKAGKGNVETYLDKENGFFYARVDLNAEELPTSNNTGKEMMAKGFFNFSHNDTRIFGNLNLNIGQNKKAIAAERDALAARVAELEAQVGETE
jgi:hypothetical protein